MPACCSTKLKRSGKLLVKTTVAGQLRVQNASINDIPRDGPCAQATHIVTALSLGAFALTAGGQKDTKLGADVQIVGTGVKTERSAELRTTP